MSEPTYRQHKLLEAIHKNGGYIKTTETENLENHWELVRSAYLKNIALIPSGWRFSLTSKATEYLSSF